MMLLYLKIIILLIGAFLFADTPDWEYSPGSYEFTSWIVGGIVLSDGQNLASTGDMFAAFDEAGNVRGVANQVDGFGPTEGQMLYEMTIGGNTDGDQIHFPYSVARLVSYIKSKENISSYSDWFYCS